MAIPRYQDLFVPVLKHLADGANDVADLRSRVASELGLTETDLTTTMKNGRGGLYNNRVAWALVDLQRAGLVSKIDDGIYAITGDGRILLATPPKQIDLEFLRNLPAYVRHRTAERSLSAGTTASAPSGEPASMTQDPLPPAEQMAELHANLISALADEILVVRL